MATTGKYENYGRTLRHRDVARNVSDPGYYHTNHLGSTAFVTDNNATVTQGFLYAPFGEITTEYAPMWQNGLIPNYTFNAKEGGRFRHPTRTPQNNCKLLIELSAQ